MFYIKINGQFLQLADDFQVDLIIENPLLLQDRIPVPYTTSFDVVLSPTNKKLLSEPSRVNKTNRTFYFDNAELGQGAFPMYKGTLIVREIGARLSANFEAAVNLDQLRKNLNELDLGRVEFGVGGYTMRTNPQWAVGMPGPTVDLPMAIYKAFWEDVHDGNRDYTAGPIRQSGNEYPSQFFGSDLFYLNALAGQNLFFNHWSFTEGNVIGIEQDLNFEYTKYAHAVMYPQLRAAYLIEVLTGITPGANPYRSNELQKLVLTSHFHPSFRDDLVRKWMGILVDNDYPASGDPSEMLFIDLASYQPAYPANEVFKSLLNIACATLFRFKDQFQLKLNKDIIADPSFSDWDKLLSSKLILTHEQALNYAYGYDAFREDTVPVDPEFVLSNISDLPGSNVNQDTQEQVFYITNTKQLILKKLKPKVNSTDPDEYIYEVRHSGLQGSGTQEGYQIGSRLSPLKMEPTTHPSSYLNTQLPPDILQYVGRYEGSRDLQYVPHIMLYHGRQTNPMASNTLTPYLAYHNYSIGGTRLGNLSLAWEGDDGLISNFHSEFKAWIESDKLQGSGQFLLNPSVIRNLDLSKKVNVRNKLWWIRKVTVPINKKRINPSEVELVEAPRP